MSTHTITSTVYGVTLGSSYYLSPLTIASTGHVQAYGSYGIYAGPSYPTPVTIINQGTIVGTIGIVLDVTGTITNAGTIVGYNGTAIYLRGTGANRLILESGYKFTGFVIGSTAAGATNTLELAGNGTLTAILQNEFFNFGTLAVDSGLWKLAASNQVGVLSNLGTIGYTGISPLGLTITESAVNSGTITDFVFLQGASLTNSGRISQGVSGIGLSLDNQAGATLVGYGHAVYDYSTAGTVVNDGLMAALQFGAAVTLKVGGIVTNDGTILAADNGSAGVLLSSGGTVTNGSTAPTAALIRGGAPQAATGYNNGNPGGTGIFGASGSVTNYGTLAGATGGAGGNAGSNFSGHNGGDGGYGGGAISFSGNGVVINSGTVVGGAGGAGGSDSGFHYGGSGGYGGPGIAIASGTVQNNNGRVVGGAGGAINFKPGGTGRGGYGVHVSGTGTVINSGTATILGGAGGAATKGRGGIGGAGLGLGGGVLSNTGTITGGTGGHDGLAGGVAGAGGAGVTVSGTAGVTNSGGTIAGGAGANAVNNTGGLHAPGNTGGGGGTGIALSAGTVINSGVIVGGNGGSGANSSYNGGNGGAGGTGVSLSGFGYVKNTGTIAGGSGGAGGSTTTHYSNGTSGAGGYGLVLGAGGTVVDSGTISGANGTAIVFGGTGGNLLVLDPGYSFTGIVAATGTNTLELRSAASAGTVAAALNTEFANFTTIAVDPGARWTFAGGGTIASGVTLTDSGVLTNAGNLTINGKLLVDPATFINSGTVSGGMTLGSGYLRNTLTGTINSTGTTVYVTVGGAAATIVNAGTITARLDAIYAKNTTTVINSGLVAQNVPTAFGRGVLLVSGGYISNSNVGTIAGYTGVGVYGGDIVFTNAGTIAAAGPGGAGVNLNNTTGTGTAINSGLIRGGSDSLGEGVALTAAPAFTNSGTIVGGRGIHIGTGSAVITNTRTVVGTAGAGVDGSYFNIGGTIYVSHNVTLTNSGTISGGNGTAVAFLGYGNLLVLEHGYSFAGGGVSVAGTANRLELLGTAGAVTVDFNDGDGFTNFGTVTFGAPSGNSEILKISNTAALPGTITGFTQFHDIIDLTQISPNGIQTPTLQNGHQLVVTNGSQTVTLNLDNENYSGVVWQAGTDGSGGTDVSVACYCRGTQIETPDGEVPVEELRIGDLVVTLSGEARSIRWIGRRAYDGRFIADNRQVLPICITAGALAEGVPARDLFVSPGHALYVDGVLIQAEHLVNGGTIVQADAVDTVEYFHIELDSHDIIVADGAPAESYTDCDNRYMFANGGDYTALYPDEDRGTWDFCRPRLEWEDEALSEIRAALLWRAAALGHELDADPDLHLVIDGEVVRPVDASDRLCRFVVPEGRSEVWLASRRSVPAETDPLSRDTRRLGVPVERLVLYDADLLIEAQHTHAALGDGFHGAELDRRWTDGMGRIPEVLLRPFAGPVTLELHLAPSALVYRAEPAAARAAA